MDKKKYSIQYAYALDTEGTLVHITKASHSKQYTCPECTEKLTPILGDLRTKHFRHYQDCCSLESYLHRCAKKAFLHSYTRAITLNKPITLVLERMVFCAGVRAALLRNSEFCCQKKELAVYDLTKLFDTAELEKYDNNLGLKPDVMLSDSKTSNRCYVEICVTHPCSEEKLQSGIPILEFKVNSESDVHMLLSGEYKSGDKRLTPHNFSPKPKTHEICSEKCSAGLTNMEMWSMNQTGRLNVEYGLLQDVDLKHNSPSNTWPKSLPSTNRRERLIDFINEIDPNHSYRLCLRCKYSTQWNNGYLKCAKKLKRVPYTEARQCAHYENT